EGISAQLFGPLSSGYGNLANAGGGGICHNSGGGGGGNGAPGGKGGTAWDGDRDVGGRGGGALLYPAPERPTFGGGGRAAHDHADSKVHGGVGGGIVFVRAASLAGAGLMTSDGTDGGTCSHDGAGGGGAGGSIYLRIVGTAALGEARARGGWGGDVWETGNG